MKRLLYALAVLAALLVVAVIVVVLIWDWNWFRDRLQDEASERSGRETIIGSIDVDWDWSMPRIVLDDIAFANAGWARDPVMFRADRLEVSIRIWNALGGDMILPELVLRKPQVALEIAEDGTANWDLGGNLAADVAAETLPEDRTEMPAIGRLVIEDGSLSYRDPGQGIDLAGRVATATGDAGDEIHLEGDGSFEGRAFSVAFTGGSVLDLRDTGKPYPVTLDARIGATTGELGGMLTDPFALTGMNITFAIAGDDMAEVFPIFGIPLPHTRPYRLEGALDHAGDIWSFTGFAGVVGDSDLRGDLEIDAGQEPPFMTAEFRSERLTFADLGGFVGATPGGEGDDLADGKLFPDTPVDLERLRAMNMDVHFVAGQIDTPGFAFETMDATLDLEDGLAVVEPLRFGIAEGEVAGSLILDGRSDVPAAALDMTIDHIAIAEFFASSAFARQMGGLLRGRIGLEGSGPSLAAMLGRGDGRLALIMTQGSISAVMVELSGLDIAEYLALELGEGDVTLPIACLAVDFDIVDGVGTSRTLLLDTSDSFIAGEGSIDLDQETIDLVIVSDPKDFSLLSLNAPIYVEGPFIDPAVSVGAEVVVPKIDFGNAEAGGGLCESLKDNLD